MVPTQFRKVFINSQIIDSNYIILKILKKVNNVMGISDGLSLMANISDTGTIFISDSDFYFNGIDNMFYASENVVDTDPALGSIGVWAHLTEADVILSDKITSAIRTFCGCKLLRQIRVTTPFIINGSYMFYNNYSLEILKGQDESSADLSTWGRFDNLKYAENMFYDTPNLSSDTNVIFPSLIDAPGMFTRSNLTAALATNLVDYLPTYTSNVHRISIGFKNGEGDVNDIIKNTATEKGWTVTLG